MKLVYKMSDKKKVKSTLLARLINGSLFKKKPKNNFIYDGKTHVMIDIETMDKTPTSAICSIGAVVFNPATGTLSEEFHLIVDLADSQKYGTVSGDTVLWWLENATKNRPEFLIKEPTKLIPALKMLNEWLGSLCSIKHLHVWGNGADFDNVILEHAYSQTGIKLPWLHWNNQHVRTVVLMGREILGINPKYTNGRDDIAHNSLGDSKFQATYVSDIWKGFESLVTLRNKLSSVELCDGELPTDGEWRWVPAHENSEPDFDVPAIPLRK